MALIVAHLNAGVILVVTVIIIMYIYHPLINALSAQIISIINLNTTCYTHVEDGPTKTIYIRHYMETRTHARTRTHTH